MTRKHDDEHDDEMQKIRDELAALKAVVAKIRPTLPEWRTFRRDLAKLRARLDELTDTDDEIESVTVFYRKEPK